MDPVPVGATIGRPRSMGIRVSAFSGESVPALCFRQRASNARPYSGRFADEKIPHDLSFEQSKFR